MSTSADPVVVPAFGVAGAAPGPEREYARARAAGYAAGWSQGAQAAQAMIRAEVDDHRAALERAATEQRDGLATATRALQRAAADLAATSAPAVHDITDALLDAALELASAVLGHEPVAVTEPGRDALHRALSAAGQERPVTVRLNPQDAATLVAEPPAGVRVVADPALGRGDSVLEHALGSVEVLLQDAVERARMELGR